MPEMLKCAQCVAESTAGARFCSGCGRASGFHRIY